MAKAFLALNYGVIAITGSAGDEIGKRVGVVEVKSWHVVTGHAQRNDQISSEIHESSALVMHVTK